MKYLINTDLKLPAEKINCKHVFHLFVVYHPKRDLIIKKLKKNKISVNINYPFPIHKMKAYKKFSPFNKKDLINTERFSKGIFSLPLYPKLRENEIIRVSNILKKILSKI